MDTVNLRPRAAHKLVVAALTGAGAKKKNISCLADSIIETELAGMAGHGFFWLPIYCQHLKSGKLDGKARPKVERLSRVAFRADAAHGFAHPAIEKGFARLVPAARKHGIAALAIHNSYNAATLGHHTARLAREGLIGFGFTNSPAAIAPVGGRKPVIGTNPLSLAVPDGKGGVAILIDQSSSVIAKSAVMKAAGEQKPIPLGWALDAEGKPTSDAAAALKGSMAPTGGHKGFGQGLIVEIMAGALSGALLGPVMGSFSADDGKHVDSGQFFIAIDPERFSAGLFGQRIENLSKSILAQEGARLPGMRRSAARKELKKRGLTLPRDLYERIVAFC